MPQPITISYTPGSKEAEKEAETPPRPSSPTSSRPSLPTPQQQKTLQDLLGMLEQKTISLEQIQTKFNASDLTDKQKEYFETEFARVKQYQNDVREYLNTYLKRIENIKPRDPKARNALTTIKEDFNKDKKIAALDQSRKHPLIQRFTDRYNSKLQAINTQQSPQQAGAQPPVSTSESKTHKIPQTTIKIVNDSTSTVFLTGDYNSNITDSRGVIKPQQTIPIKNEKGQDFYTLAPGATYSLQGDVNSLNIEYVPLGAFQNEQTVTTNLQGYQHHPFIKKYEPYTITHLPKEPLTIHINVDYKYSFYNTITPDAVTVLNNPALNGISYEDLDLKSVYKPYEILQVASNAGYATVEQKIKAYRQEFSKKLKDPVNIAALQLLERAAFYAQAGSQQQRDMLAALGEHINRALLGLEPMPIEAGKIITDEKTHASTYVPNVAWDDKYIPLVEIKQPLLQQFGYGDQQQFVKLYMARALILYYYYLARKEGHIFNEGTFVVSDYQKGVGALFNFLVNMPNTNMRAASHFNSLAKISQQDFAHLGQTMTSENFYEFELPDLAKDAQLEKGEHPKTAILFNKLETRGGIVPIDVESSGLNLLATTPIRLFIKPETFSTKGFYNKLWHGVELAQALTRRFITPGDANDVPEYSKERVPKYLTEKFNKLLDTTIHNINAKRDRSMDDKSTLTAHVNKLRLHGKDDSFGIQSMYRLTDPTLMGESTADKVIVKYASGPAQELHSLLEQEQKSADPIKRAKRTDLKHRFGNEVILSPEKYLPFIRGK